MMSAQAPAPVGRHHRALSMRGTVEGFYGPAWSHAERLAHLEFSAQVGLNAYLYAPKHDPYHRARWRDPYPARELAQLAELAATARALGIRFTYAISPGLSMRYADHADDRALAAKAGQLYDAGIGSFALLFDDVPTELIRPEELVRWPGAGGSGAAHGEVATRFLAEFLAPRGIREPLLICPTDYAGTDVTAYRRQFARTAPADALVAWTGHDIVVGTVTRDDIDRAAGSYQRRLVLWDNFPVNDFEPSRLFLGPLTGRATDLDGSALVGVLANPMVRAAPSRIPLVSVADWAADPRGYDGEASARRALAIVAGTGAADLAPLVRACSGWPPGADPDAELAHAVDDALAGAPGALGVLAGRLEELAAGCRAAVRPQELVSALRPWLDAGAAGAEAGLAAVHLLRAAAAPGAGTAARADERIQSLREAARLALSGAESFYADTLRSVISPFVREVLDRTAPAGPGDADGDAPALLLTGRRRTAGDEAITELLERRGYRVSRRDVPGPDEIEQAALVVVTRGANAAAIAAVARVGVPLLAWHGLVPLGLARRSEVLLARDRVRIVDPDDPIAAGFDGVVSVYRGPAKLTTADVGPEARVVARVVDEDRPALFHYPSGAGLADGTSAPAPRIGLFLGADGPAPWLLNEAGRAIVEAALDRSAVAIPRQAVPADAHRASRDGEPAPAGDGGVRPG